jgi:hypothetical protein
VGADTCSNLVSCWLRCRRRRVRAVDDFDPFERAGPSRRRYWSERHGRGPRSEPVSGDQLRELLFNVFDEFDDRGYFQEAFGYDCVDAGAVYGTTGRDPNAYFLRKLGRAPLWPYRAHADAYADIDTLYDVVELLHDLVSKPDEAAGRFHSYGDCGWHFEKFFEAPGQRDFRLEVNGTLALQDPPARLNGDGHIALKAQDAGYETLLAAPVPSAEPELVDRVEAATRRFKASRTRDDLRHAVRDLYDALEKVRPTVKAELLTADEAALFQLANNFGIRHLNDRQKLDYESDPWLRWQFYVALATVHLVLRLRMRAPIEP